MTESVKEDFLSSWKFQDYLSFGYLYLLIVGIVSDSIYYGMVGINIISYSTILDVLLSPIVRLTDSITFPIIIIILPGLMYFYIKFIIKIETRRREKAIAAGKVTADSKPKTSQLRMQTVWFLFTCLVIFCAFMGYGVGGGHKQKSRLASGELNINHEIQYQDGTSENVMVIGNNSEYVFYVSRGDSTVSVSPTKDSILSIRELSKSEREEIKINTKY